MDKETIKGLELAAQLPLSFAPGFLQSTGLISSFTIIDRPKVRQSVGGPLLTLPGTSKIAYTVGAYYEDNGIGLRGSYTYRSNYVNGDRNYFGDGSVQKGYGQLDLSASYDFNDNVGVVVDVTNLLNEKSHETNNFGLVRYYIDNGTRITAGVNLKF